MPTQHNIHHILTKNTINLLVFLHNCGYEGRLVGGAVRDWVIGKSIKDIDIATTMPAELMLEKASEYGIKCIPTGLSHGTVTILLNGESFQVTTLRKDIDTDGRHAKIEFTDSWIEDSKRRDFTFNALYMDINGKIYDFHNGLSDLNDKKIRFIGDPKQRIQEDFLRIFRYFRFLTRYSVNYIDNDTIEIIKNQAFGLSRVSVERIINEMLGILELSDCHHTLDLMIYAIDDFWNINHNYIKDAFDLGFFDHLSVEERLLTLLCCNSEESFSNASPKLPKAIREKGKKILHLINRFIQTEDIRDELLDFPPGDRENYVKILVIKIYHENQDKAHRMFQELNEFIKSIKYEFTLTGSDIINRFNLSGGDIGVKLRHTREIWKKSRGQKSMEECML